MMPAEVTTDAANVSFAAVDMIPQVFDTFSS